MTDPIVHKRWRDRNRDKIKVRNKSYNLTQAAKDSFSRYRKSEQGKAMNRVRARLYYQRNKEKVKARQLAQVIPLQPCERCCDINAERHHSNYSKPFDVTFLCSKCHTLEHRKQKELSGTS